MDDQPTFRLSVLDQSPVGEGTSPGEALRNSVDLARLADRLGYHRYWVAEHHASPALACNAPEVLIGPIAAATRRIRVGSGGIMLPHYSPFKVAEAFGMLAAMYPDRVDLGLGRAAGTDSRTTYALQRDRREAAPDDFFDHLQELLAYLDGTLPAEHPFARLADRIAGRPEPFLLGSSPQSAAWAAELGLPYVFADFINFTGEKIAAHYRSNFAGPGKPYQIVAAWVLCADTDEEAERLARPHRMLIDLLHRGQLIPVPTVETATAYFESQAASRVPTVARRVITGTPETVRPAVERLAAAYGADEVMVVAITHGHAERRRSYELLADAFDLAGVGRRELVAV